MGQLRNHKGPSMNSHPLRRFIGAAMCILGLGLASPSSAELSNPLPSASREQLLAQRDELWADLATSIGDACPSHEISMECLDEDEATRLCRQVFELDEQLQRKAGDYDLIAARLLCAHEGVGFYKSEGAAPSGSEEEPNLPQSRRLVALQQIYSDSLRYRGAYDLLTFEARTRLLTSAASGFVAGTRQFQKLREAHDVTLAAIQKSVQAVSSDIHQVRQAVRNLEQQWGSEHTLLPILLHRLHDHLLRVRYGVENNLQHKADYSYELRKLRTPVWSHAYASNSPNETWLHRHIFSTSLRILGPYDPLALTAASWVLSDLIAERRFVEAEDLLTNQLGKRHPFTIRQAYRLRNAYRHLGLDRELWTFCESLSSEMPRARHRTTVLEHSTYASDYAEMLEMLGIMAQEQKNEADATRFFSEALQRADLVPEVPQASLFIAQRKLAERDFDGAFQLASKLAASVYVQMVLTKVRQMERGQVGREAHGLALKDALSAERKLEAHRFKAAFTIASEFLRRNAFDHESICASVQYSRPTIDKTDIELGSVEALVRACMHLPSCSPRFNASAVQTLLEVASASAVSMNRRHFARSSGQRRRKLRTYLALGLRHAFQQLQDCSDCTSQKEDMASYQSLGVVGLMAGWGTMHDLEAASLRKAVSRRHPQLRAAVTKLQRFDNEATTLLESWNPFFAIQPEAGGAEEFRQRVDRLVRETCPEFEEIGVRSCAPGRPDFIPLEELPLDEVLSAALPQCFEKLDSQIAAEDPAYRMLTSSSFVNPEDIQPFLGENEALVTYVIDDVSLVGVVRKNSIEFQPLDWRNDQGERVPLTRADVERLVDTLSGSLEFDPLLESRPKAFSAKAAHDLYRMLFEPIEPWLAGVDHILLVKDAPIARLPFELLVTEGPVTEWLDEIDPKQPPAWLIEDYAFSTLPGLQALRFLREAEVSSNRNEKENFLGIGNPLLANRASDLFGSSDKPIVLGGRADLDEVRKLPAIPQTGEALHGMARRFESRGYRTRVLEGEQAREQALHALTLSDYSWITFLTHALVAGENGTAEPAIVLTPPPLSPNNETPDPRDDGVLTMSDVAQLDVAAEFVVLGGCRTAAPKASGGEALSGLAKAFFYAGAESLLVSHWPVHVGSGIELLDGMVRKLTDDRTLGKSQALRQASLELMRRAGEVDMAAKPWWLPESLWTRSTPTVPKRYAHPFYWASFFLVGDGAKPLAALSITPQSGINVPSGSSKSLHSSSTN